MSLPGLGKPSIVWWLDDRMLNGDLLQTTTLNQFPSHPRPGREDTYRLKENEGVYY
jgi:hypothetical protein